MSKHITSEHITLECYECAGSLNLRPAWLRKEQQQIWLCEYCRGEKEVITQAYDYWSRYTT